MKFLSKGRFQTFFLFFKEALPNILSETQANSLAAKSAPQGLAEYRRESRPFSAGEL